MSIFISAYYYSITNCTQLASLDMFVTWELGLMGIFLRQNPEVFKELSRMCIFHTHHPTSQFSAMKKKKSFEKQGQISREKSLICEKKENKNGGEKTVVRRGLNLNVGHHCIKYLWRGSAHQTSLSLSGFKEREREREKKKYLVWWCLNQIFGQAPTTAAALRLLCRRHTQSHTHKNGKVKIPFS